MRTKTLAFKDWRENNHQLTKNLKNSLYNNLQAHLLMWPIPGTWPDARLEPVLKAPNNNNKHTVYESRDRAEPGCI